MQLMRLEISHLQILSHPFHIGQRRSCAAAARTCCLGSHQDCFLKELQLGPRGIRCS